MKESAHRLSLRRQQRTFQTLPLKSRPSAAPCFALGLELSEVLGSALCGFPAADLAGISGHNGVRNRPAAVGTFESHEHTIQQGSLNGKKDRRASNTTLAYDGSDRQRLPSQVYTVGVPDFQNANSRNNILTEGRCQDAGRSD
jgi:hypothetical protein